MICYLFLGIVQGITEFLPISSSGHLVIFQRLFGMHEQVVFFDVVLHVGSLCSLLVFFRTDLFVLFSNFLSAIIDIVFRRRFGYVLRYNDKFRLCIYLMVTVAVTGSIALLGKNFFESLFESIPWLIVGFIITGVVLLSTKHYHFGQRYLQHILLRDAFFVGILQSFAIVPSISRSGMTLCALFFRNVDKESAFKFSFLVSIPLIAGAFIVKLHDVVSLERTIPFGYLLVGFLASFVSGLIALNVLRMIILGRNFYKFAYYCFAMALLVLMLKIKHLV